MTWHQFSSADSRFASPSPGPDRPSPGRLPPASDVDDGRLGVLAELWRAWVRGRARAVRLSDAERAALLRDAGRSLRLGRLGDAEASARRSGDRAAHDAARLNLLGVLCDLRGQSGAAKRHYGRAIRADRRFAPAQQNMRRAYELITLGGTGRALAVGDALTDLWLSRHSSLPLPGRGVQPRDAAAR